MMFDDVKLSLNEYIQAAEIYAKVMLSCFFDTGFANGWAFSWANNNNNNNNNNNIADNVYGAVIMT